MRVMLRRWVGRWAVATGLFLLVSAGGCVSEPPLGADVIRLRLELTVDGCVLVHVRGSEVWLEHITGALPGQMEGQRHGVEVNGIAWHPQWHGRVSRRFAGVAPEPLYADAKVLLRDGRGRGEVRVVQMPDSSTDHTLVIRVDDTRKRGAAWYRVECSW